MGPKGHSRSFEVNWDESEQVMDFRYLKGVEQTHEHIGLEEHKLPLIVVHDPVVHRVCEEVPLETHSRVNYGLGYGKWLPDQIRQESQIGGV